MNEQIISDYAISQLCIVVALSFVVERALSVPFGTRVFIARWSGKSLKEVIAVAVSIGVCIHWKVDVVAALVSGESGPKRLLGMVLTAGVVAGGAKASLKLFQDILGMKSKAELEEPKPAEQPLPPPPASG